MRNLLFGGIAALGIGLAGAAAAQTTNVMAVPLPSGGVAEIHYAGNVPPRVVFSETPAPFGAWMPVASVFGPGSPFAMFERISAEMDRRAAAMLRYADWVATQARSGQLTEAAWRPLPAGSQSYSFVSTTSGVSTMSGNGVCTRSLQITATGDGSPPRVVSHSAGDCGPMAGPGGGVVRVPAAPAPAPARPRQPDLILTQSEGANPYAGMIRQVAAAPR
jgi:hypothetical protein